MVKQLGKIEGKYFPFLFHYYRAEVYRETVWRNRLDVTTNWSIVVTAAILSFTFSNEGVSHVIIIINYLVVLFFLYIEARRFRYYALLRERTKIMEKHVLAPIFGREEDEDTISEWFDRLSQSLAKPKVTMTRVESISWRLRRNYIFILPLLYVVWLSMVVSYPRPAASFYTIFTKASIGFVPGNLVFIAMTLSIILLFFTALYIPRRYGRDDLP